MKIYTRTGDLGRTSLLGRSGISKADPRVVCIGECDEMNTWLALLRGSLDEVAAALSDTVFCVQQGLFDLGEELARAKGSPDQWKVSGQWVASVEQWIDEMDRQLPPLRQFIVPGGAPCAITAQLCRAVCRRLERNMAALAAEELINPQSLCWVNRLSDWLFVLGRYVTYLTGSDEPLRAPPQWPTLQL